MNIERLGQDRFSEGLGHEPLYVQGSGRPAATAFLDRAQQRLGSAAVDQRAGLWGAEQVGQWQEAALVLRPHRHLVAMGGELVEEGHGGAGPAAVDQPPLRAGSGRGLDHPGA